MKYYKLGKLPIDAVNFFYDELIKRKLPNTPYQWIQFDQSLHLEFLKIFTNTELRVQRSFDKVYPVQKAFYSEPGYGFRIHKDGIKCRSAVNIVISCNKTDWVRWYDEDYINGLAATEINTNIMKNSHGASRSVNVVNYEEVKFTEELHNEIGDVYAINVDTYHSFKCVGDNPRIIIQTKFENFPDIETITKSLIKNSFSNLVNL
jgi:hypothetical protein